MSVLSPYNPSNPYWVGAADNPYDIGHACYPYKGIFNETSCGALFPSDSEDLYHYDNVNNPYHPDNQNHIILKNGEVVNTENPYNPESPLNPYHPDNPYKVDTTPCDEATKPSWIENIYKPCHPDNPFRPPVVQPPTRECEITFSLTARSVPDSRFNPKYIPYRTEPDAILQVLPNRMRTLLKDDIYKFRQQFLDETPNIHSFDSTETQTYCADPVIPDSEQLTLVVDNASGLFHIPVGGLSSSGSECLYDWDIWIDHRYTGRFIGYSGLRTEGIELNLKPEAAKFGTTVTAIPSYTRFSNAEDVNIDIRVLADGGWDCIPFWVRLDNAGILLDRGLGIYDELLIVSGLKFKSPNADNATIKIRNKLDVRVSDWLIQGFVFYPNRPLNDCAIEVCVLDIRHAMYFYNDITLGNPPKSVNEIRCIEPAFTLSSGRIQMNASSELNYHAKCALENFVNEITETIVKESDSKTASVLNTTLIVGARNTNSVSKSDCKPPVFQVQAAARKQVRESLLSAGDRRRIQCQWHPIEDGKSVITIRPHYASKSWFGWLRAFGFHHSSPELWNTQENKDKLLEVNADITPAMIADSPSDAGNYCMRYWLYGCRNVKPGRAFRFTAWEDVERAGNDFLFKAFYGCEAFDFLPLDYEEPKFKAVGNNYKAYKFYECRNMKDVGLILAEPPVESAGDAFEAFEYYGCEKLLRLPDNYTEPQTLTGTNMADHQIYKFALCQSLYTMPFNYKESPLTHVHDSYHAYKFSNSGLRYLPIFYSEALSLTFIGKNCCTGKFKDCLLLESLPAEYTEINPANMNINFIKNKFSGCVSLIVNNNYKFPTLTADMLGKSGVFAGAFAIVGGLLQNVTAVGIINGNAVPSDDRGTFSGIFGDYGTLNENWKS